MSVNYMAPSCAYYTTFQPTIYIFLKYEAINIWTLFTLHYAHYYVPINVNESHTRTFPGKREPCSLLNSTLE